MNLAYLSDVEPFWQVRVWREGATEFFGKKIDLKKLPNATDLAFDFDTGVLRYIYLRRTTIPKVSR